MDIETNEEPRRFRHNAWWPSKNKILIRAESGPDTSKWWDVFPIEKSVRLNISELRDLAQFLEELADFAEDEVQ